MRNKKKKYKIRFVINEKGIYNVIGKKKLNPLKEWVRYKNKAYLIDVNNPTYTQGLNLFFLIDVKGKSIELTKGKRKLEKIEIEKKKKKKDVISEILTTAIVDYDPEAVDLVIFKKIVKQLSSNLNANAFVINLIAIIIGISIGGPIGWILGGM